MSRTLAVALREFLATVLTKGFIFGVFIMPLVITGLMVFVMPLMLSRGGPAVSGVVAVIDRTPGQLVAHGIAAALKPESLQAEHDEEVRQISDAAEDAMKKAGQGGAAKGLSRAAAAQVVPPAAHLTVQVLPPDSDLQLAKSRIPVGGIQGDDSTLAVIVIPTEAVIAPAGTTAYGGFSVFTVSKLDFQVTRTIERKVQDVVLDARIKASGLDQGRVRALVSRPLPDTQEVTAQGLRRGGGELAGTFFPFAFLFLLWISVFTAGQYLLTTTIEEKSSRVMEVLLSAVSPMQLMVGKIVGQMGVGLLILVMYAALGVGALSSFSLLDMLDWTNIGFLIVFFLIAFFLVAALMAAVGSAVSDIREAQSLMMPVMIVLMLPMLLWMPIGRNPNGVFATILSFIPPVSPFVMVMRIPASAGSTPVPLWQIALSIVVGIGAVVVFAWAAAKVFRIGVLMYGKPPNFATLIKWIRMA